MTNYVDVNMMTSKQGNFFKTMMVFKILKKMVPKYMLEKYVFEREVCCYSTRASSNDMIYIYILVGLSEMVNKYFLYTSCYLE